MSTKRGFDHDRKLVRDPRQIEVLASAARQEIIDVVKSLGPCPVAEMARQLGRSADSLYYHVRRLESVGLLKRQALRRRGGREGSLYRTPRPRSRLVYETSNAANVRAVGRVVTSMLRVAERDFRRALRPGAVVEGLRRNLWAARATTWLTGSELEEINRLLRRVLEIIESRRSPDGRRLYTLTWVLAPLAAKSPNRQD